jgi:hypothetical protein
MGMNPETHQFERLDTEEKLQSATARKWKIFQLGETVILKDTKFTVTDIQPKKLTLRPHGLETL